MDSTNFQHHHLQHQQQRQQQQHEQHQQQQHRALEEAHFVGCSSLNNNPSAAAAAYHAAVSTSLDWNPGFLSAPSRTSSNGFSNKLYDNEFHATNGDHSRLSDNTPIVDNDARNFSYPATSNLPKIEEDMLSSFPSFGGGLIHNTSMENHGCWFNNNNNGFVSASTTGAQYGSLLDHKNHHQLSPYNNNNWSTNGNGFPSTSLLNQLGLVASSPNSTTTSISSSPRLVLNLQATDFFRNNAGLGSQNQSLYDSGSCVGDEVISPLAGKIMPNNKQASNMMSNGVIGTKRAAGNCSSDQQPKSSTSNHTSATNKKSQSKVSCPPFKVRKEKLGDRIASLHQLVSPFGKTDTASVLTEAIGYIQFLQNQIHTLCMPHAKPPRNKPCRRPFQVGAGGEDDGKEEARVDIRRRGLCLVPVSWTSYVTPTQMDTSNLAYF